MRIGVQAAGSALAGPADVQGLWLFAGWPDIGAVGGTGAVWQPRDTVLLLTSCMKVIRKRGEQIGAYRIAGLMSRSVQKPSEAKQRDAELARVEAELKIARGQLDAVNAEIKRSQMILVSLTAPQVDRGDALESNGGFRGYRFPAHDDRKGPCGDGSPA